MGCCLETVLSPLSPALPSGQSFVHLHLRVVEGRCKSLGLSAKVQKSDGACVLVSEQFHVEHLRVCVCVCVCCVLDL